MKKPMEERVIPLGNQRHTVEEYVVSCENNYVEETIIPWKNRWRKELFPLGNQRHTGEEYVVSCENNYVEETIIP